MVRAQASADAIVRLDAGIFAAWFDRDSGLRPAATADVAAVGYYGPRQSLLQIAWCSLRSPGREVICMVGDADS